MKQQVNGKLLQDSTKDHCTSWKVRQGRELPLKMLLIPKAYGHSLPHRHWSTRLSAQGCALHSGQLAEWEEKVLGPRIRRSIGNLS